MADISYQPPRLRNILIGILLFMVLLVSLCNLPSVMKMVGNVFLFIPSHLGLIQTVKAEEIRTIDLSTPSPKLLDIGRAGLYAVYTSDYDLLLNNINNGPVWLRVKSHSTGEGVTVLTVGRGARPYDTYLADGRPIFVFEVPVPGSYEIAYYFRQASIDIVPDYNTGKEPVIVLAISVQIAILLTLLGITYGLYSHRNRGLTKGLEIARAQHRIKGRAFWEAEIQKGKKASQKKQ
jgi:hypothetical protein